MQMRLINRLIQQRFCLPRPRLPSEQAIFRVGIVKFALALERVVYEVLAVFCKVPNSLLLQGFFVLGIHGVLCSLQDSVSAVAVPILSGWAIAQLRCLHFLPDEKSGGATDEANSNRVMMQAEQCAHNKCASSRELQVFSDGLRRCCGHDSSGIRFK